MTPLERAKAAHAALRARNAMTYGEDAALADVLSPTERASETALETGEPLEGSRLWRCEKELTKAQNALRQVLVVLTNRTENTREALHVAKLYAAKETFTDGSGSTLIDLEDAQARDYEGHGWIKVKRFVDDASKTWEERFRALETHHNTEAEFLIAKVRELAARRVKT